MTKSFRFGFTVSVPGQPDGKQMSADEAEALLLGRLEERGACHDTLWALSWLHSITGRQRTAFEYMERLATATDDREVVAACYLAQGQLMEQMNDYRAAIPFYERGRSLRPTRPHTWYFVHNNLGYCLNQLGRYEEAETHLRTAIDIAAERPNAFKNLGLSLQGQGRWAAAARSFVDAVKANASDPRAAKHLEDLLAQHRAAVAAEIPDIDEQLEASKEAVETARVVGENLQAQARKQGGGSSV